MEEGVQKWLLSGQGGHSAGDSGGWFHATKRCVLPRGPWNSCCVQMFKNDAGSIIPGSSGETEGPVAHTRAWEEIASLGISFPL